MDEFKETLWFIIIAAFLLPIVVFFITRAFWNWCFLIGQRLDEQKKTNQLLEEIIGILLQSNAGKGNIVNEDYLLNEHSLKEKKIAPQISEEQQIVEEQQIRDKVRLERLEKARLREENLLRSFDFKKKGK